MGYLILYHENGTQEILGDTEQVNNQLKKEKGQPYIANNGRKISQYEVELTDKYGE